ncbi:hypothetical protein NBRC116188_25500 [Oceaniserpentilla sp. 4NH20-0058]|uniref:hypothetical protein n=1 Tax=Oceaniserpentilla sp. 4NH20-0058 TaxID=3127660 RepID=UPI00310C25E5
MFNSLHSVEKVTYPLILLVLLIGSMTAVISPDYYTKVLAKEDGPIEWLTVVGLLLSLCVAINRVISLRKSKNAGFLAVWAFLALVCFFGAGEEISWGQRIFNIESSEWFKQNNAQQETNLHNLIVEGKKVNKVIFSTLLGLALLTYLLVFTFAYRKSTGFKGFCDTLGVPIAHYHQVIAWFTIAIIAQVLIKDVSRSSELFESAAVFVFLLNISFPYNRSIFAK